MSYVELCKWIAYLGTDPKEWRFEKSAEQQRAEFAAFKERYMSLAPKGKS